jgi:putative oxidoreductase
MLESLLRRGSAIVASLAFLPPLLTRLAIGQAFHLTGHGKLMNFDRTVDFFASLGIPFPHVNAAFIATLEFVGGLCLILGLGTRIFAGLLSCSMIVALMTADKADFVSKFWTAITDVTPAVYLLFLIWLVVYGPGPVSLDALIGKWYRARRK